jgi:L-lactate permease
VALNASGASGAKMLAPHSVAIVLAALGSSEEEGNIIRFISKMLMLYLFILMIVSWVGVKFM